MMGWIRRLQRELRRQRETQAWVDARRARYEAHLRSEYWRRLRERALGRAEHRCEWVTRTGRRCTCRSRLQVHHRHYETFGRETLADVQVLCPRHHEIADRRRERRRHR